MGVCAECGSVSGPGAAACALCRRPVAVQPLAVPELVRTGSPELPEPSEPSARPVPVLLAAVRQWLTGDWRPALAALVAPTALLLLAALGLGLTGRQDFGTVLPLLPRSRSALSLLLTAFGAPWHAAEQDGPQFGVSESDYQIHLLAMTVTAAWAGLLWFGLRRHAARGGLTGRSAAYGAAVRTALAAGALTLLIGLLTDVTWTGQDWQPGGAGDGSLTVRITSGTTVAAAVAGTVLLAGLVALARYGAHGLRREAERNAALGHWLAAARVAGRALLITVTAASAVALVLLVVRGDWTLTAAALVALPNLGLLLLGFGSGATLQAGTVRSNALGGPSATDGWHASLLDLGGLGAWWQLSVLLAVGAAVVLAAAVRAGGLDPLGRLRVALLYAAALSVLTMAAGAGYSTALRVGDYRQPAAAGVEALLDTSFALGWGGLLVATALWTAVGALVLPALLEGSLPCSGVRRAAVAEPVEPAPAAAAYLPPSSEVLDSHRRG